MLLLCSFVHSTLSPSRELLAPHLPSLHLPRALPSSSPVPRAPLLALTPLSATWMRHWPPARGCWQLAVMLVLSSALPHAGRDRAPRGCPAGCEAPGHHLAPPEPKTSSVTPRVNPISRSHLHLSVSQGPHTLPERRMPASPVWERHCPSLCNTTGDPGI